MWLKLAKNRENVDSIDGKKHQVVEMAENIQAEEEKHEQEDGFGQRTKCR